MNEKSTTNIRPANRRGAARLAAVQALYQLANVNYQRGNFFEAKRYVGEIIEKHEGMVFVDSERGKGTKFEILLPKDLYNSEEID